MIPTLDYDTTVALLHQAVAAKGADFVYERIQCDKSIAGGLCTNFFDDQPSCIVGHVVSLAGFTTADLDQRMDTVTMRDGTVHRVFSDDVNGAIDVLFHPADQMTVVLLEVTQGAQDNGMPWGLAVALGMTTAEQWRDEHRVSMPLSCITHYAKDDGWDHDSWEWGGPDPDLPMQVTSPKEEA